MLAAPDQQVSFTDPDSRSMATSGRGSGMVGYNVQAAVDTTNHLIVAHEVTNVGTDKSHLANMPTRRRWSGWARYRKNRLSRSRPGPSRPVNCSYSGTINVSTRPGRVEDGRGSLGALGHRPVSHPRSSNRTCRFPASGFPTGFTAMHATGPLWASVEGTERQVLDE